MCVPDAAERKDTSKDRDSEGAPLAREAVSPLDDGSRFPSSSNYGSIVVGMSVSDVTYTIPNAPSRKSIKTPGATWCHDVRIPGSIPHSIGAAILIGTVCGLAASLYYAALEWALEMVWKKLPLYIFGDEEIFSQNPASMFPSILWVPLVGMVMATGVGLTVRFVGEPGDLASTIRCVHESATIGLDHVGPMLLASQCSILAAGSLGPEAPLVAICAALAGGLSRQCLGSANDRNILRKHTLMGMSGALAAFFGCPLGGSLFALEVCSRFGVEYFEHTIEAILAGEICLAVFRFASGLPIQAIWSITDVKLTTTDSVQILYGITLGLLGALIAFLFAQFHRRVIQTFRSLDLLTESSKAVQRGWLGAVVIVSVGMMIPQTLFWGEFEFQTIATMAPVASLPHAYPARSLIGFEMHSCLTALVVGVAKLICISFTVAGGYRGGYIFPLFSAAAAFGCAVHFITPFVPLQLCVLCLAAAVNVAVTRTAIGSTLILAYLSGEPNAIASILAASLVSLLATAYMPPFIATQTPRLDLDQSLFQNFDYNEDSLKLRHKIGDHNRTDSQSGETEELTPFSYDHKHMVDDEVECQMA